MKHIAFPIQSWPSWPKPGRVVPLAGVTAILAALAAIYAISPSAAGDKSPAERLRTDVVVATPEQALQLTSGAEAQLVSEGEEARERNGLIPLSKIALERPRKFVELSASASGYGNALKCLTEAVYYEAATEPMAGQRAVAQVVLNRVMHPAYPDSVCGVVYQGSDQSVCQFSFTCDGSLDRQPVPSLWRRAREVAERALAGGSEPLVGTATNYHADYVLPRWAFTLPKITQIGTHIFYRLPGRAGGARAMVARWNGVEVIPDRNAMLAGMDADGLQPDSGLSVPPQIADRHAPTDVGGRLDTRTEWRLTISDPVAASQGYRKSVEQQGSAAASRDVMQ